MKVRSLLVAPVRGGFFYDDQAAIRAGAQHDGEAYAGEPVTPGFDAVRMPAVGLGVGLELEDGTVVWGDAISVQYPGVGGREPPLRPAEVAPAVSALPLAELDTSSFRAADEAVRALLREAGLRSLALEYGLSQALLAAAAHAGRCTIAEVVCREFDLPLIPKPVPIFAQSGDRRRENADKMILKGVDVLPHGLVNTPAKLGELLDYLTWLARRIRQLNPSPEYRPTLHVDLYGVAGEVLGSDAAVCELLLGAAAAAAPFPLRIETPVIAGSREEQIVRLRGIRDALHAAGAPVELVADEWCNTLDDIRAFVAAGACDMAQVKMPDLGSVANSILGVLECRAGGVKAYLGGSCAETETSARVSVHVAVATQADMQLAKPGMGVDEGLMLVGNEQARLLASLTRAARS